MFVQNIRMFAEFFGVLFHLLFYGAELGDYAESLE